MPPLVSIVVPVYNVERYLERCVESILNQTCRNLEVILVDDGSPDRCGEICDAYARQDSRIRVIHKENGGVSSARNAGLELTSGDFLMYVDPDDYISGDAVQVLLDRMLHDGSDMAIGKHADVYADGHTDGWFCAWMGDAVLSSRDIFLQLGESNYYPVSNSVKLYRKGLFDGLRYPPLACGEDVWMFPRVVERCRKISVVDKTVYFYYQRDDSIVHVRSERVILDDLKAVLNLSEYLFENGFEKSAARWFAVGIDRAFALKRTRKGLAVFQETFPLPQRKKLLKKLPFKKKLKWLLLGVPVLYPAANFLKKLTERRNL